MAIGHSGNDHHHEPSRTQARGHLYFRDSIETMNTGVPISVFIIMIIAIIWVDNLKIRREKHSMLFTSEQVSVWHMDPILEGVRPVYCSLDSEAVRPDAERYHFLPWPAGCEL